MKLEDYSKYVKPAKVTNDVSLKDALLAYFNTNPKFKSRLYKSKIKMSWEQLMGHTVNRYTSEIKLRGKKLIIHVTSSPLRYELLMEKPKILQLMNEALGEAYIEEVIIK